MARSAASFGRAAILPLPLATAITRSAAPAAPRLAGHRRPPELRVPLLLRHLSKSAVNSHGHGHKNAVHGPPCTVTAASAASPDYAPAPAAASRTFLCAKTSSIRPTLRPGSSARTCADDSSLLVIPSPEKIHSVCTSKRVSLLKSKL